jgi:hypothetical protein
MEKPLRILLPIIAFSLFVIGVLAINYSDQTYTPTLEVPVFSYASPESQGISNETVTELTDIVQGYFDEELIVGAERARILRTSYTVNLRFHFG